LSGIYIHIPFCKQACNYCNFHFSTSLRHRDYMTDALLTELDQRADYLRGATVETIYFGGGTPSLLPMRDLERIFGQIHRLHTVTPDAEVTLEANPDDLTADYLADLRRYTPVNRLSIGIQSFSDADLVWMNRAHNAQHARQCIELARQAGFEDLTIDLIYGTPTLTDALWADNLRIAIGHGVPHLSCYCLTVEEGTALHHHVRKGQRPPVDEEQAARQLEYLMATAQDAGYEQYEISNFALPDRYARHNSNYWRGAPYLGIGPSAHSFDGTSREWNAAHNALYINGIQAGVRPFEREELTTSQRYNEYVMTLLRTRWGCDPEAIEQKFGAPYKANFEAQIVPFVLEKKVKQVDGIWQLTDAGRLLADHIAMRLFWSGSDA
jgi:putative oxygen-independent coproporphyrinogen III oxidase